MEILEDAVKLRDLQDFFDLRRQADHLHIAALLDHAHVAVHEGADAGAVEVHQVADVEDNLFVALAHQVADGLAKDSAGEGRKLTAEIDDGDGTGVANCSREIHDFLFWTDGTAGLYIARDAGVIKIDEKWGNGRSEHLHSGASTEMSCGFGSSSGYWRISTRTPRRQLSARPTRTTSIDADRLRS